MPRGKGRTKTRACLRDNSSPDKQRTEKKMADAGKGEKGEDDMKTITGHLKTIITRIDSVDTKLEGLNAKNNALEKVVNGDGGIVEEFEGAKEIIGETQADISTLRDAVSENSHVVRILAAIIEKQDKQLRDVKLELDELRMREMRGNVLFHNIPENPDENLKESVVSSFRHIERMENIVYDRIHRLGHPSKDSKPRIIVAKPRYYEDAERLLKVRKPGLNKQTDPWISPQHPESVRECRIQLSIMAQEMKKKDPSVKTKLSNTRLIVNGQPVNPPLQPVSAATVQLLPKVEQEELKAVAEKMVKISPKTITGSSFTAHATTVKSLNGVRTIQKAILLNPESARASHNIVAYILPTGESGYYDDGDHGMGRRMLQTLEQRGESSGVIVIITRHDHGASRTKIGPRRFDVIRDLTRNVCNVLYHETIETIDDDDENARSRSNGDSLLLTPRRSQHQRDRTPRRSHTQFQPPSSGRILRSQVAISQAEITHTSTEDNVQSIRSDNSDGPMNIELDPLDIHHDRLAPEEDLSQEDSA